MKRALAVDESSLVSYLSTIRQQQRQSSQMLNGTPNPQECSCLAGVVFYDDFIERALGDDSRGGEVTVLRCKRCGQFWLHYLMEYPHLTGAARWVHGPISPEMAASVEPETACALLERLNWYFRGGSAFGGEVIKTSPGRLNLWLSVSAPASAQTRDDHPI